MINDKRKENDLLEKIKPEAVEMLGVSSLPTSPTNPSATGSGYSATQIKQAFDRLSVHIIEHYNRLIDALHSDLDTSILAEIPTGIFEEHTLSDLIRDITSGNIASYLMLGDQSLAEGICTLSERISRLEEKI